MKINSLLWSRRDPLGIKLRKFEWKIWIICHKVETTKWLKIPRKSCLERGGWIFYFLIRFNIGNTRVWIALYIFHSNRRISLKHFKSWEQQQFTAPKLLLTTKTLVTIIKSGFSLTKIFVVYRESRSRQEVYCSFLYNTSSHSVKNEKFCQRNKNYFLIKSMAVTTCDKTLSVVQDPNCFVAFLILCIHINSTAGAFTLLYFSFVWQLAVQDPHCLCLFWYYSYGLSEMFPRIWYCDMIRKGSTVPWVFNYRNVLFRYAGSYWAESW